MRWWKSSAKAKEESANPGADRRREPRIGGKFKVRYSGSDGDTIIIGNGTITDLSRYGFGIQGNKHVKQGMELGLFLELPDLESPLCIPRLLSPGSMDDGSALSCELIERKSRNGWSIFRNNDLLSR